MQLPCRLHPVPIVSWVSSKISYRNNANIAEHYLTDDAKGGKADNQTATTCILGHGTMRQGTE